MERLAIWTYILDPKDVLAVLCRFDTSSLLNSICVYQLFVPLAERAAELTLSATRSSSCTATSQAFSYPSAIRIGWIPRSKRDSAEDRRAPARTAG